MIINKIEYMGELIDKKISVSIDGRRLFAFKSFELKQSLNTHHSFELVIDIETGANRYVHDLKDKCRVARKTAHGARIAFGKADFLRRDHRCEPAPQK